MEIIKTKHVFINGCYLSPIIFNAYIREAIDLIKERIQLGVKLNGWKIEMLRFADDI